MIIKEYKTGTLTNTEEVTCLELGSGPLVYFSSDYIPAYIPQEARVRLRDIFRNWQDQVLVLAQMINDELTVLSISMDGRLVSALEMEHLCERMGLRAARKLYSGPFNEYLLQLTEQALVKSDTANLLWRRE